MGWCIGTCMIWVFQLDPTPYTFLWLTRVTDAFSSRGAFLKAIQTKEVDGENKAEYNEDLLPTEPGKLFLEAFSGYF